MPAASSQASCSSGQRILQSANEQADPIGREAVTGNIEHFRSCVDPDELRVGVAAENSLRRLTCHCPELENRPGTHTRRLRRLVLQLVVATTNQRCMRSASPEYMDGPEPDAIDSS
jgi:hypothetical protein